VFSPFSFINKALNIGLLYISLPMSQELVRDEEIEGVPVCAANYSSPVVEQGNFIEEISYTIGNRKYIENAPHF
jgi:hypothetical protein